MDDYDDPGAYFAALDDWEREQDARLASRDRRRRQKEAASKMAGATNVIKVRFVKDCETAGREYTYYVLEPVSVGDIVDVETERGTVQAQVSRVNVPQEEIARFGKRARSISGRTLCRCEECKFLGHDDGHGNRICIRRPAAFPIVGGTATTDYLSCKGSFYQKGQAAPSYLSGPIEREDGQIEISIPLPARTPWD